MALGSSVKIFSALGAVALFVLNTSFFLLYVSWQVADGAAIHRMESASGMDLAQMLPNANLMWVAANGSLIALLALEVLVVTYAVRKFGADVSAVRRTTVQ